MAKIQPSISLKADGKYIPALDGVRAISILIVLISHIGFGKIIPGGFGVTIFFFVSGFLITRLLISEQNKRDGSINLPNFYIRRFLRLMPAMYCFILFTYFFSLGFGVRATGLQLFSAATYWVNYYDAFAGWINDWPQRAAPWGHLWSLAVEEHFYLMFPFALTIFGRNHKSRVIFIALVIVAVSIWRYIAASQLHFPDLYMYSATDCRIENIAWGCLLAVMLDGVDNSRKHIGVLVGWQGVVIGLAGLFFSLLYRDDAFRDTWRYTVQGAAMFILILNLYCFRTIAPLIKILELKPFRFGGRLSYSLYLWHFPIFWAYYHYIGKDIGEGLLPVPLMLMAIICAIMVSLLSYYYIEKPFFGLRKKFGGKPVEELRAKGN